MNKTVKEKIDQYLEDNVKKTKDWSEYEKHKMALFCLVSTHPEEFEYAIQKIVERMSL